MVNARELPVISQSHGASGPTKAAGDAPHPPTTKRPAWLGWLVGIGLLAAVVMMAAHVSDLRELVRVVRRIEPVWLAVALLLQLGTYASQAAIWRVMGRVASSAISARFAFQLSVAELFMDQALPSGGASGTAFVARVLRNRGYPADVISAGVVARVAAYSAGYALALGTALLLLWTDEPWGGSAVRAGTAMFCVVSALITVLLPQLTGRQLGARWPRLAKLWGVRRALAFVDGASPLLARSPRLLIGASALQVLTILLDAATMWVLLRALGSLVPLRSVFTSFMLASVVRSLGIAPGGLGTFEATSVLTLHAAGASMEMALAATLVFRGVSFWLPMIPGFALSRRIAARNRFPSRGQS